MLIGEGTYGKVYNPPLLCKGKQLNSKKVGKVFSDKQDYQDELKIARFIENINSSHIFSIPFYETCPQNLQLIYKNGGKDLYDYISENNPKNFKDIYKNLKYICYGIKTLLDNHKVHQDIKLENIVYDGKKLYLIDFGLMDKTSGIYKNKSFLKYEYLAFPPEYKRYVYDKNYQSYFLNHLESKSIFYFIKKHIYPDYKEDLTILKEKPTYPTDKIDIYSLGMVLAQLYRWSNKENKKIAYIIKNMIRFDPSKRWNIHQVLEHF